MNRVGAASKIYARERPLTSQAVCGIFQRQEFRQSLGLPDRKITPLPHAASWQMMIEKIRLTDSPLAALIETRLAAKQIALTSLVPVRDAFLDKDNVLEILKRRSLREMLDLPPLNEQYAKHTLENISVFAHLARGRGIEEAEVDALENTLPKRPARSHYSPEREGIELGLKLSEEATPDIKEWAQATAEAAKEKFIDPYDRRYSDVLFIAAVTRTLRFSSLVQMVDFLWRVERHLTKEKGRLVGRIIARLYENEEDSLRSELLKILMGRFAPYPAGEIVIAAIRGLGGKATRNLRPRVELAIKLGLEQYGEDTQKLRRYLSAVEKSNNLRRNSLVRQYIKE